MLKVRHVALLGAEQKAVVAVWVAGILPVVAEVTTPLIIVTCIKAALVDGHGHGAD